MPRSKSMNPAQKRAKEAERDPIGDLRERVAKVETKVTYGFPILGAYITVLKFAPSNVSQIPSAPVKGAAIVLGAVVKLFH